MILKFLFSQKIKHFNHFSRFKTLFSPITFTYSQFPQFFFQNQTFNVRSIKALIISFLFSQLFSFIFACFSMCLKFPHIFVCHSDKYYWFPSLFGLICSQIFFRGLNGVILLIFPCSSNQKIDDSDQTLYSPPNASRFDQTFLSNWSYPVFSANLGFDFVSRIIRILCSSF